jgi:hypothetical protein
LRLVWAFQLATLGRAEVGQAFGRFAIQSVIQPVTGCAGDAMHSPRWLQNSPVEASLDENTDGRGLSAEHSFRSMLAGPPTPVALPCESERKHLFNIRAAQTTRERRSASNLLSRMYATRGYECEHLDDEESEHAKTFLASDHNSAIGTLTIGLDSSSGLKLEALFPDEVGRFRDSGNRICEFTKLAMDRRARSPRLLASMFHVAYIYAHRVRNSLTC